MARRISRKERHIRWNWEQSPERNADNNPYVRYHFVVVDDKDRETIMNQLISGLTTYGEIIPIRKTGGKVKGSEFRYLFCTYDSSINPDIIKFQDIKKPVKKDSDLRERKRGNIEDYIAGTYS